VVSATDPHGRNLGFLDPTTKRIEREKQMSGWNRRRKREGRKIKKEE
jgi:hypothetical protein